MATLLAGCLLQAACRQSITTFCTVAESSHHCDCVRYFHRHATADELDDRPEFQVVFGAVASIVTEQGEENVQPLTDNEWTNVRNNAVILLEAGNLLMLEARARPSIVQDVADWNTKARAMSAAARTAIDAIDVKDPEALFAASETFIKLHRLS